ncbi:MAG: hypothetical protein WC797_01215 [Candidatus Paceibacterota bacterium]|jgi:hypothetical protein
MSWWFVNIAHAAGSSIALVQSIKTKIINPVIGFIAALAAIMFVWGVVEFVSGSDNETKRDEGKQHILWGVIGLTIIVSVQGILKMICDTISCGIM